MAKRKKDKRTNNDLQNTTQKTKDREHGNHTKTDKSCTFFFCREQNEQ
jgi:hypothetical protein